MADSDLSLTTNSQIAPISPTGGELAPQENYTGEGMSPEQYLQAHPDVEDTTDLDPNEKIGRSPAKISEKKQTQKTITAHNFWNSSIQKVFDKQPEHIRKAWIDSFAIVEKGYNKKAQDLEARLTPSEELCDIIEVLQPRLETFAKLGMSPAEYLELLITFDERLAKNPVREINKLIIKFQIPPAALQRDYDEAYYALQTTEQVSPEVSKLKRELKELRNFVVGSAGSGEVFADPQEDKKVDLAADSILGKIEAFYGQQNSRGEKLYPGASENMQAICVCLEQGYNLDDAYRQVVLNKKPQAVAPAKQSNQSVLNASRDYEEEDFPDGSNPSEMFSAKAEREFLERALRRIEG